MQTMSAYLQARSLTEIPSVNYCRHCRIVCFIINDIIAGIRLGRAKKWYQLFTDGTSRRQCKLQNLVLELYHTYKPLIVSSCILIVNESAEAQVELIDALKARLQALRDVLVREYPEKNDLLVLVPTEDSIGMQEKLGDNGVVTGDTCATAQKTNRLLQVEIDGKTFILHCTHHMRNV